MNFCPYACTYNSIASGWDCAGHRVSFQSPVWTMVSEFQCIPAFLLQNTLSLPCSDALVWPITSEEQSVIVHIWRRLNHIPSQVGPLISQTLKFQNQLLMASHMLGKRIAVTSHFSEGGVSAHQLPKKHFQPVHWISNTHGATHLLSLHQPPKEYFLLSNNVSGHLSTYTAPEHLLAFQGTFSTYRHDSRLHKKSTRHLRSLS